MTTENTQALGPNPGEDEEVVAGEPVAATDEETSSDVEHATEQESDEEETPTAEAEESDPDLDAYVDGLAAQLTAADPAKYDALLGKFQSDEPFAKDEIAWISSTTGLNEPTIRYGLSLQREEYKRHVADEAAKAETSIADAEAEVGNLKELIETARGHVPAERWAELVEENKLAERLGVRAKKNGDAKGVEAANLMTMNILRELKDIRDSIPGKKPKTLGHLSASQGTTQTTPKPAPAVDDATRQAAEIETALDARLSRMSDQFLAGLVQKTSTDPAERARAVTILKSRGVI